MKPAAETGRSASSKTQSSLDLAARFDTIDAALRAHRLLWQASPFVTPRPAWEDARPALAAALRALDAETLDRLEQRPEDIPSLPAAFHADCRALRALAIVPPLPRQALRAPSWQSTSIPGRKWSQLIAFGQCALPGLGDGLLVDWCAGKGHLGRTVGRWSGLPVLAIERDPVLCAAGTDLAARAGIPVRFQCADVLTTPPSAALDARSTVLALHACGDLSAHALALVRTTGAGALVAPCCYHVTDGAQYRPVSLAGQRSALVLRRAHLRLPSQQASTGPQRRRSLRHREQAWRAGLELLRQQATGEAAYRPLRSLPRAWFRASFADFCVRARDELGVPLPARWDPAAAERAGWARAHEARALSVVQAPFRRLIELWVLLDRALALAEAGRTVALGRFCPPALTPRNLMLRVSPA